MGRLTAREYGRKARDIAQQARHRSRCAVDRRGSSTTIPPTY
jgi:hypothetical protein